MMQAVFRCRHTCKSLRKVIFLFSVFLHVYTRATTSNRRDGWNKQQQPQHSIVRLDIVECCLHKREYGRIELEKFMLRLVFPFVRFSCSCHCCCCYSNIYIVFFALAAFSLSTTLCRRIVKNHEKVFCLLLSFSVHFPNHFLSPFFSLSLCVRKQGAILFLWKNIFYFCLVQIEK